MLWAWGAIGASTFPLGWVAAAEKRPQKLLYYTRSTGYEHSAVRRDNGGLSVSDKALIAMGKVIVPVLRPHLKSDDPEIRHRIRLILEKLGAGAESGRPDLLPVPSGSVLCRLR